MASWKITYYIFSWGSMVVGFITAMFVLFFTFTLTTFEDHPKDIWASSVIILQGAILSPSSFKPKRFMLQLFFGCALLVSVITATTFLTFHYNFILHPRYEEQIDNFERMVSHKLLVAGDEYIRDYLMQQNMVKSEILFGFDS